MSMLSSSISLIADAPEVDDVIKYDTSDVASNIHPVVDDGNIEESGGDDEDEDEAEDDDVVLISVWLSGISGLG